LADHLDTRLCSKDGLESAPEQIVVVDDENADPRRRIAAVLRAPRAIHVTFSADLPTLARLAAVARLQID
jgi:hypothetical protein